MNAQWFSDKAVSTLLKANSAFFLAALLLNRVCAWLLIAALLLWVFTLVCLVQRDLACKRFSFVTAFYILLALAVSVWAVYAVVYHIIH